MIEDAATSGILEDDPQLLSLLYRWRQFGGGEAMTKYVEKLTSTTNGFLKFLVGFMVMVYSSAGNYKRIQTGAISELFSLDKAREKANQIKDSDLVDASPKAKEA